MPTSSSHPPSPERQDQRAPAALLLLTRWESFCGWLLAVTDRWPRSARFTFAIRVQNLALDIADSLVVARYEPRRRQGELDESNLRLERMRTLLRLARTRGFIGGKTYERAMVEIDESGRMLHGWRQSTRRRR